MIMGVTPIILLFMAFKNFQLEFTKAYEGYPFHALLTFGWIMVGTTLLMAFFLAYAFKWKIDIKQEGFRT